LRIQLLLLRLLDWCPCRLAESVRLLLLLLGYLYCSGTGPAFRATVATPGLVLSVQPD